LEKLLKKSPRSYYKKRLPFEKKNINGNRNGYKNKKMPLREKSRSTSGSAWTAFSRGFICPFFSLVSFYGVRLYRRAKRADLYNTSARRSAIG